MMGDGYPLGWDCVVCAGFFGTNIKKVMRMFNSQTCGVQGGRYMDSWRCGV